MHNMRKGNLEAARLDEDRATRGRINDAPLYIDDSPNMTLVEIRAKCRRLRQKVGLKMVVIDYLQLMTCGKRVESRQQEVSEFSRALKLLAKELQRAGHRAVAAEPWSRAARRQEAGALRPA